MNNEDIPTISELEAQQGNGKELGLGSKAQEEYTPEELEAIHVDLGNQIYAAAYLLEEHEQYHGKGPGCLLGNGHAVRQQAAQRVQNLFVEGLKPRYKSYFESDGFGGYRLRPSLKELKALAKDLVDGSIGNSEAQESALKRLQKKFGKNAKLKFF